jgi:hypothetical protein
MIANQIFEVFVNFHQITSLKFQMNHCRSTWHHGAYDVNISNLESFLLVVDFIRPGSIPFTGMH